MAKLTNCKLNNLDINLNVKPYEMSINQSINETVEKKPSNTSVVLENPFLYSIDSIIEL